MIVRRRLYLHFMDAYHVRRAERNAHSTTSVTEEARRAFRISLCLAERVYLPASSFFESALARHILLTHPISSALGRVWLTSGDSSLEEHREGKIAQYHAESPLALGTAYLKAVDSDVGYQRRSGQTRLHLVSRWLGRLRMDRLLEDVDPLGQLGLTPALERAWERVPDELGGLAFVPGHAERILARLWRGNIHTVSPYMTKLIESSYVEMYMMSLGAGVIRDLVRLASPFPLPTHPDSVSYARALAIVVENGLLRVLDTPEESAFLTNIDRLRRILTTTEPRASQDSGICRPDIGIVTVLEEEFRALLLQLEDPAVTAIKDDPHAYVCGRLPSRTRQGSPDVEVVLMKQLRMTNPSAATATISMIKAFPTVQEVLLVGIAGAIPRPHVPDKNVALGDVVLSDRIGVWHTDHVTVFRGIRVPRGGLPPPSPRLIGAVDRLAAYGHLPASMQARLDKLARQDARFTRPLPATDVLYSPSRRVIRRGGVSAQSRVFRGVIASGNPLVRDAYERDRIGRASGALALDMEGAGVAEAAWSTNRRYFVVRGLSDYCDSDKNDQWHWFASAAAAAVSVSIVEQIGD
jgi:nucleoside phosphorylase